MKKYTLLSLLLAAVMLLSAGALPAAAAAPEKLDFSDAGSPVKVNVSASEFLTFLLGKEISATEADFLDSKLGDVFSYSEYVPQKNVEATYRDGELNVTAEKYETTYYFNAMFPERVPNSAGFSSYRGMYGAAAPAEFIEVQSGAFWCNKTLNP